MNPLHSALTLLALSALPTLGVAAGPHWIQPKWSSQQLGSLKQGVPIVLLPGKAPLEGTHLGGAIWVDATSGQVWTVISNPEAHPEYLRDVKRSVLLESRRNYQLIDHEVKLGILPMKLKYCYEATHQAGRAIDFKLVRGDLRHFEGRWRLMDASSLGLPAGTLVFYQLHLDPGGIIPQNVVEKNLRKDLPQMLELLRKRVYQVASS